MAAEYQGRSTLWAMSERGNAKRGKQHQEEKRGKRPSAGSAHSPDGTAGRSTVNFEEILVSVTAFVAARGVR